MLITTIEITSCGWCMTQIIAPEEDNFSSAKQREEDIHLCRLKLYSSWKQMLRSCSPCYAPKSNFWKNGIPRRSLQHDSDPPYKSLEEGWYGAGWRGLMAMNVDTHFRTRALKTNQTWVDGGTQKQQISFARKSDEKINNCCFSVSQFTVMYPLGKPLVKPQDASMIRAQSVVPQH